MKRGVVIKSALAAIAMVASVISLSSCSEADEELSANDIALKQNIVGKWKTYSVDGQPSVTDKKGVITYNPNGTMTSTTFRNKKAQYATNSSYYLNGSSYIEINSSYYVQAVINTINDEELIYSDFSNNEGFKCQSMVSHKISKDFSKAIVGVWEGVMMTGEETHGTADHRWEYKEDGSYIYYSKDANGNWVADASNTENEYYVDGDFFGSRWIKNGKEYREWWDMEKCDSNEMVWTALRKKANGTYFNTTMVMRRIK